MGAPPAGAISLLSALRKNMFGAGNRPQGELGVNVHSFLPDLKEKSRLFSSLSLPLRI